jgi:CP family cyanate transporter-like MFS transporter
VGSQARASAGFRSASRTALVVSVLGLVLVAFNQRPAVASVPPVLGELGLGPTAESLLVTIPVVCFGLGALAGPRVRRIFGEERAIFILIAFLVSAIVVRAAFVGWTLFPTTVVIGLSIAVLNVLMPSLVKRRFPDRPGAMTSAYVASATLGPALAAGLTVPIFHAAGGSVNVALGAWALPGVIALAVWAPQLRVGRAGAAGMGAMQMSAVETAAGSPAKPTAPRPAPVRSGAPSQLPSGILGRPIPIWRRRLAWQVMAYMGIGSLVFYGPLSWLPEIYQSRGVDPATAGYLLLVMNFLGMVGSLIAPLLAGRMRDQRIAVLVSAGVTFVGFFGLLLGPTGIAFFWMAILGIGQGAQFGLALLLIVLRAADGQVAARLSSMAQSGGYLIAATGPLVMGLIHSVTAGWFVPITFLILATVVGLACGYQAAREKLIKA